MEKATLKQNIAREILIAIVCILLAISNTAFGAKTTKTQLKGKGQKEQKKKKTMRLSADEQILFEKLTKENQQELKIANDDMPELATNYKKILVYNMAGDLLQEQDTKKAAIDLTKLPKGAKLLTIEDDLAIYLVL